MVIIVVIVTCRKYEINLSFKNCISIKTDTIFGTFRLINGPLYDILKNMSVLKTLNQSLKIETANLVSIQNR